MNNLSFKQSIQLIDTMARMKMKAQANKMLLSYLWWVLEPLLFVGMFYVVFEYVLHRGGDNFFTFLIVGKTTFLWFSKGISGGSRALVDNKGIIGQRPIEKWIFPIVNVQEATYRSMISIGVMLMIVGVSQNIVWSNLYQLVPLIIAQYLFIVSIAILLSILVAFAEDFGQLISLAIMGLMFTSGVFWDINSISNPELQQWILWLNPVAALLDNYRQIIIHGNTLELQDYSSILGFTTLSFLISIFFLKRWGNNITRFLFS